LWGQITHHYGGRRKTACWSGTHENQMCDWNLFVNMSLFQHLDAVWPQYVSNGLLWVCRLCRGGVAWVASRRVYCDLVSFLEGLLWACLISRSCIMPHASAVSCLMSHHLQVPDAHQSRRVPWEHGDAHILGPARRRKREGHRGMLGARTSVHHHWWFMWHVSGYDSLC